MFRLLLVTLLVMLPVIAQEDDDVAIVTGSVVEEEEVVQGEGVLVDPVPSDVSTDDEEQDGDDDDDSDVIDGNVIDVTVDVENKVTCADGSVCCLSKEEWCFGMDFEIHDQKGMWSEVFDDSTGLTQRLDTAIGDCRVWSNGTSIMEFVEEIERKAMWKFNLATVNIKIWKNKKKKKTITSLKLLRSSHESDYIYLPIQVSDFTPIQNFMPVSSLYNDKTIRTVDLVVEDECDEWWEDPRSRGWYYKGGMYYDVLTAHVAFINKYVAMFKLERNGTIEQEETLDSVCVTTIPDSEKRRGVPFEWVHCCSHKEKNLFEEEEDSKEGHYVNPFECHRPSGSVYNIRRYTLILMGIFLVFVPLLVACFPSRPEPYKVLRDVNRRGHRLYNMTSDDKHVTINWEDGDVTGAVEEMEEVEEVEEEKLVDENPDPPNDAGNGDVTKNEKITLTDNNNDNVIEELPPVVKEGKDFRNQLPDRLYLDSDPEFHLNLYICFSYLLLFHVDSHILMVVRRLVVFYLVWMIVGLGMFIYMKYYPVLLFEPIIMYQSDKVIQPIYTEIMSDLGIAATFRFFTYILPAFMTLISVITLSPILLRKRPIAETLHCDGDLRFFGDPFPESLVEMKLLKRTPKPSKPWTYEDLLYRNMVARLRNLCKPLFWKLLWERWVCRGPRCRGREQGVKPSVIDYICVVFWLPVCLVLVVFHTLPIFSVWANYLRREIKAAFGFTTSTDSSKIQRALKIPLLVLQFVGIFMFYIMTWNLLVIFGQFMVFLMIDILRHATQTLSKIILILGISMYLRSAFADFEDNYRELKSVTFTLCKERAAEIEEEEETTAVVKMKPHEPLYVQTKDGEASMPRRIFYDICKTYRPYAKEVAMTFSRLFLSFALIIVLFALIVKFQIFEEFSEVGETLLTVATVTLPSMLGMMKSAHHQGLADQRREAHIRMWLEKITTGAKVNMNLHKPTKRVVSTC